MNPARPIKIPRYFIDVARWPANSTLPRECNINRNRAAAAARVKTFIGVDQPRSSLHLYYSGSLYARYFNSSTSPQFSTQESTGIYPPPPVLSSTPIRRRDFANRAVFRILQYDYKIEHCDFEHSNFLFWIVLFAIME